MTNKLYTITDIKKYFCVAYNTAKNMIIDVAKTGSTNVFLYNKKIGVFDLDTFIKELNKLQEERCKEKKLKKSEKEVKYITSTQQSMVNEYADQLAKII